MSTRNVPARGQGRDDNQNATVAGRGHHAGGTRKHSVEIGDWAWIRFRQLSGQSNPASYIRDTLYALLSDPDWAASVQQASDDHTVASIANSPRNVDRGRVFILTRAAFCDECGSVMEAGETGVIRTNNNGHKEILHINHFRKDGSDAAPTD